MLRLAGTIFTAAVILFWLVMNGLLISRQLERRGLDEYRRGVIDFLGDRVRRERYLVIRRQNRRIGESFTALERRLGRDELGYRVEFRLRLEIDLLGKGEITLEGSLDLDARLLPETLAGGLQTGATRLRISGKREGEHFLVRLLGSGTDVTLPLPLREFYPGNGLAPLPPLAGLRVGDVIRVPVLDPLFGERVETETRVLAAVKREVEAMPLDCLLLETKYRGMTFRSWVTEDGEVVRQELPPPIDVVLQREEPPAKPAKAAPGKAAAGESPEKSPEKSDAKEKRR